MKHVWKMLMAALLALMLLLPVLGAAEEVETDKVYGMCLADKVRVRKQPSTTANMWFYIDEGFIAEILDVRTDSEGNATWYKVNSEHPTPNGRTYIGYVAAGFFRPLTKAETDEYLGVVSTPAPDVTEVPGPTEDTGDEVEYDGQEVVDASGRTNDAANLRSQPSIDAGKVLVVIPADTEVTITGVPADPENGWYRVAYEGQTGYVHGSLIEVTAAGATPTPDPGFGTEVTGVMGRITADGVRFRIGPGTGYAIITELDEGVEVEILTIPDAIGADYWYRVRHDGTVGYIQSNYIRVEKPAETDAPADDDDPAGEEDDLLVTATGMITADGVNFRIGPGMSYGTMGKLNADTVVELLTIPAIIDANHWYQVRYNGQTGYIQAPFIRVLTLDESYLPNDSLYGYAMLVENSAHLRYEPGGEHITQWRGKGSLLRIVGKEVAKGSFMWFPVYYDVDHTIYYVRGDMIEVVLMDDGEVVTPTPNPEVSDYGFVITTEYGVNLRIKPGGESVAQIPRNTILACVGAPVSPAQSKTSYTWYYVKYNGMYGYLRGDCVRVCDAEGGSTGVTPTPEPTTPPVVTDAPVSQGYIKLIKSNVNLRVWPLKASQGWLPKDLILPLIGPIVPADTYGKYCWYEVRTADGREGFIRGDCAMLCDYEGEEATPAPTVEPEEPDLTGVSGTVLENAYFRKEASADSDSHTVIKAGTVVTVLRIPEDTENGWYKISYDGNTGYVHASLIALVVLPEDEPTEAPTATPEPTAAPEDMLTSFVMTTASKVNVRKSYSQDSDRVDQIRDKGTVLPFCGYKDVGTVRWYNVIHLDQELWMHGAYLKVMTVAEYNEWAAANPDIAPDVTANLGYLILTSDKVNVRNAANGSKIITQLAKGTVIRYYAEPVSVGDYSWYRILTPDGAFGYIRSDMVEKCDQYGDPLPTPTPSIGGSTSSAPDSQQEADYTDLKRGSTGPAVANLVAELINQGYYKGSVTSSYTDAVYEAVKAFQAVKGLTVDGIAGDKTQHALFGTKPIGSGNTGDLEFAIYPVEKIDWFTGGIQEMLPRGANFKIYDVKTGIVWWAHRWAGGKHADIETLTAADSARLCEIYGVDNLQQIVTGNMWQRRPCLVTIGTRTFACSLDGMQHGTDTIPNNNMDGQICLHFTNSTGHSPGAGVSTSHAEAIEYAYNNCPAGQKK